MKNLLDNDQLREIEETRDVLNEALNTIHENNAGLAAIIETAQARALPVFLDKFALELLQYTDALDPMMEDSVERIMEILNRQEGDQLCLNLENK